MRYEKKSDVIDEVGAHEVSWWDAQEIVFFWKFLKRCAMGQICDGGCSAPFWIHVVW